MTGPRVRRDGSFQERQEIRAASTSNSGGAKVMADGGYQGNAEVIMPYRKPRKGQSPLPQWKEDLNTVHASVRARAEHAPAHMKTWNILRNCRRKRDGVSHATRSIALMHNLTMTV
ncbi:transposase family protein [Amycolatopsis lurida]